MIVSGNRKKSTNVFSGFKKFQKLFSSLPFNCVTIKIPSKTIFLVSLLSVIVWTVFLSYLIYRNTPKPLVTELANVVGMNVDLKKKKSLESLIAVALTPINIARAQFFSPDIPKVNIDIKFKHFQKIQRIREVAIADRQLTQGGNDYVPAKISSGNRDINVKLRLKGDGIDHLLGDKWSFRIHVKGKDHLFGMRRFSIQAPATRNYEAEPLFFHALRREGLLAPRYFFIEVVLNGKDIGLMAVEEHFSKELLESQGRREGVILKFNEFLIHEELNGSNGFFPRLANYKNVDIQPFKSKSISRSEKLTVQLETARGLVRGFQSGKLSASQVFDSDIMGRFIALADLWGAWHTLQWHNIRLYFNPITTKLEPIGFDGTVKEHRNAFPSGYPFATDLLSDENIFEAYKKNVERITQENIDGKFLDWTIPFKEKQLRILHKDFPFLRGINLEKLNERMQARRLEVLNYGSNYEIILKAFLYKDQGKSYLELVNLLPEPVLISSIKLVGDKTNELSDLSTQPSLEYPVKLAPTLVGRTPKSTILKLTNSSGKLSASIEISAQILNQKDSKRIISPVSYHPMIEKASIPTETINSLIQKYSFLAFDKNSKMVSVKHGQWDLIGWIVIPEKISLFIGKGTELRFGPSAGIISYGPVIINGTQKAPVILRGLDASGKNPTWQGIIVSKSQETSTWSHVQIKNTSGVNNNGWALSGGVNFYESDIILDHVLFDGNRSEDALNIVRSKFELKNVTIKNTTSDAFDSDFSNGSVENSVFENIGSQGGGDGIDVSGSEVIVTQTTFDNISDKALSVGESSNMDASGLTIKNVSIGAASKDGSQLFLSDSKITGAKKAGLMAYIKKPEYGTAEITAKALAFSTTAKRAISQEGSKILIDGVEVSPENLQVKELYSSTSKS